MPNVIKHEGTVEERTGYATVHRCKRSYHIVLQMSLVKALGLRGRDEIKMVVSKTGRSVPYRALPPFIKKSVMKADVCSSDMEKPVVDPPADGTEEQEPIADMQEE